MIKVTVVLALVFLALGLSTASFAGAQRLYGVTNDDNPTAGANTATVFQVHTGPASIAVLKTLKTGGTGLGSGYFAAPRIGIERNESCIFVVDAASSDIAAFKVLGFAKVGNYSNSALNSDYEGMGLAASAQGNYLYAGYSGSDNIATWAIGTGDDLCALTLVPGSITNAGDAVAPLAVSHDGNTLIVSELNNEFLDSYSLSAGVPTPVSHQSTSSCGFPAGIDISGNALVVTGDATLSQTYCTATLAGSTLSAVSSNTLTGAGSGIGNIESVEFDKDAWITGNGYVYFGAAGFGGGGSFANGGFSVNKVTSGVISAAATDYYDAYASNNDGAVYASNAATTTVTAMGLQSIVWQVDSTDSVTNIVNFYTLNSSGITRYASVADPNANGTAFVLTISAFPGR